MSTACFTSSQVMGGRPLVYMFPAGQKPAIDALKQKTQSVLGVQPYIVLMSGNVKAAASSLKTLGLDAVSSYVTATGWTTPNQPPSYQDGIAKPEQQFWEDASSLGVKLVPPISAGWDPRPREYYPMPWSNPKCKECYVQDPTMDELAAQTAAGVAYARQHAGVVEAQTVIISAWNENDEGHWIVPSLFNGTQKLVAVQRGIQQGLGEQ